MTGVTYPYASGDLLEDRHTYFYSPYEGKPFLVAWRTQRDALMENLPQAAPPPPSAEDGYTPNGDVVETDALLEHLFAAISKRRIEDAQVRERLDQLVKKFEVTKRIHRAYGPSFRAQDAADYKDPARYLRLAEVFEVAYGATGGLPYLNALLKCIDTLSTLVGKLSKAGRSRLAWLAGRELLHVRALADSMKVSL